jgi:hypothetical protein
MAALFKIPTVLIMGLKKHKKPLLFILMALVASSCVQPAESAFAIELSALKSCNNDTSCMSEIVLTLGKKEGWQTALDVFDDFVSASETIISGHVVTHSIVEVSKLDLAAVGKLDLDPRDIGFVHGWVGWYLRDRTDAGLVYSKICDADKNKDLSEDCGHGFGHAVYQQTHKDLASRVKACEDLANYARTPEIATGQCLGGLLMSYGEPAPRYDKKEIPPMSQKEATDLCNSYKGLIAERCWPHIVWFFYKEPAAIEKYTDMCLKSSDPSWCGDGLGSYVILQSQFEPVPAMKMCLSLKDSKNAYDMDILTKIKDGCVKSVILSDLSTWWREGNTTRRSFPCEDVPDDLGTCKKVRAILKERPCEKDQDIERVMLCLHNKKSPEPRS